MALASRPADRDPGNPKTHLWLFVIAVVAALASFVYFLAVVARAVPARDQAAEPETTSTAAGTTMPASPGPMAAPSAEAGPSVDPDRLGAAIRVVLTPDEAATTGVAVMTVDGRLLGGLNEDLPGYAASTFKLAVLFEAEQRVAAGELQYTDRILITDEARAGDLGTIDRLPIADDGTVSLGEALHAMVTYSDNATAVALLRLFGPAAIDSTLRELGATTFSVNDRTLPTTPRDLAVVMAAIVRGEGMTAAERDHALGLLFAQQIRVGIPAALDGADGVLQVGNKTGSWTNATRDVALVETTAGRYVVAIMAEGDWNWELIRRAARAVHEDFTQR
jgi:beta-lactamase class A